MMMVADRHGADKQVRSVLQLLLPHLDGCPDYDPRENVDCVWELRWRKREV